MMLEEKKRTQNSDTEVGPTRASAILGISLPLAILRMDSGELPFRRIGKRRRVRMKDVLALKARLDAQRVIMDALVADTENLIVNHGLGGIDETVETLRRRLDQYNRTGLQADEAFYDDLSGDGDDAAEGCECLKGRHHRF